MEALEFQHPIDTTTQARNIARDLEFSLEKEDPSEMRVFRILEELKRKNLLESEVSRVKKLFEKELKSFEGGLEESSWEILTILDLFDEETAIHCVDTYLIARSKIEKKLWNGLILVGAFKEEGVTLSQFCRACLLHDVGKIEVPHSVLVNRLTDEDCASMLFENKQEILVPALKKKFGENYVLPESLTNSGELLVYLHDGLHIRPQSLAPVKLLLNKPIKEEIILQLTHCGCSIEDSLLKVIRTHDEYSKKILKELGFPIEGELAGAHHRHTIEDIKYKITVGAMQTTVDLADIIHLADVENAILSKRSYKEGKTPIDALKVLSIHSKQGFIESYIAYLWIADEMNRIKKEVIENNDQANFNGLVKFLEEEHSKHSTWPDWKVDYN